jgi:hypothetical protein
MTPVIPRCSAVPSLEPNREVRRQEWVWVLFVATVIVAASTSPYLAGYLAQTSQMRFDGAVLDTADYHSHLAKMWQGYRGHWRYRLLFTPENHRGAYLQTFYVALGHLARVSSVRVPAIYQAARVGFAFLMLLTIYRFTAHFAASVRVRRTAFLLATVASGLGWMKEIVARTPPGGVSPMSFWLLDGYTYLSLLTFPHFSLAITLLLAIFSLLVRRPEGPLPVEGVTAALLSVGLGIIHPYMLLVADLTPVLYWVVAGFGTRRMWKGSLAVAAMCVLQLPLLAYDLWVFRSRPIFAAWSAQNVTLSPSLGVYGWGYGLLLILALVGALGRDRLGRRDSAFLFLWIGLVAVLIHLPWNLQRRFLEGLQVPLGLLAGVGLVQLSESVAQLQRRRELLQVAVVSLAAVGNLYITAGLTIAAATHAPALFWRDDFLAGVEWLGQNSSWEETVLSAPQTGSLIPAAIGHRVVIGHGMETIKYAEKQAHVARFFSESVSNADRLALIDEWGVRWVFYGPEERKLDGFDPESTKWLVPVFRTGSVIIYRVSTGGVR